MLAACCYENDSYIPFLGAYQFSKPYTVNSRHVYVKKEDVYTVFSFRKLIEKGSI